LPDTISHWFEKFMDIPYTPLPPNEKKIDSKYIHVPEIEI
jgi:hypothetical protein